MPVGWIGPHVSHIVFCKNDENSRPIVKGNGMTINLIRNKQCNYFQWIQESLNYLKGGHDNFEQSYEWYLIQDDRHSHARA